MDYIEHLDAEGIKPKKYIVGDKETDGHTHVFYLRDDLPRATSVSSIKDHVSYHAHSIFADPEGTLFCAPAQPSNHIHTTIREVPLDD